MRSALLTLTLALLPLGLSATIPGFEIAKKIELSALEDRGLTALERPLLIDRDRAVYIAGQRGRAHIVWLADHTEYQLRIPLRAGKNRRPTAIDLLFYDTPHEQAAVLITEHARLKRYTIATWDLAADRITDRIEVARVHPQRAQSELLPLGYSPATRRLYCQETHVSRSGRQPWRVSVFSMRTGGNPRLVGRIETARRIHHVYYDSRHERALAVEYAERGTGDPSPVGHLFYLRSGEIRRLPLPLTTYGAAFSSDETIVHAYSSQLGQVWAISTETRQVQWRRRAGGLGHALGAVEGNSLLLVREAGLQLMDASTGRRRNFLAMSRVVDGISHPEGSLVAAGQAMVRNGDHLHFVRITGTPSESR